MYKSIIYLICVSLLVFMFTLLLKSASGKSRLSTRLFALTTLLTAVWATCLWVADTTERLFIARFFLNFAVFFLTLVTWLFLLFAINYPKKAKKNLFPILWAAIIYNLIFLLLTINQQIITHVSISAFGASIERATTVYTIHVVQSNLFIIFSLGLLNMRKKKLTAVERSRISFMTLGTLVALVGNGLSGSVATYAEGLAWLNLVATASTVSFVLVIGYAIMKHKLFDVRSLVVRSTTYLLLVLLFGAVFALVFFGIIVKLPGQSDISGFQQFVYVALVILLAFIFQPLKRVFGKITNKYFYQDAYEAQALIDELNQTLVSTIDLQKMLRASANILERNIKPEFCVFALKETEYEEQRFISNVQKKFGAEDVSLARMTLPQFKQKVIVADYLEESYKDLQAKMRKNDVAVLVRLTTDVDSEGIGAIALGAKKSGNMYNSQDIQVLEIVANSLVIAIDNALRFEEIQKFNITLEQKVDDATRKLRRANEKLIALDQTKDDFISMASHQLRTPLTSVKGYLSMVLEGDTGKVSPKQAEMLEQAFTSSQRMVYLIADLLNVSRLRTGKFVIESKPTNLADVIEGEIGQLMTTAAGKNQELTYDKPKNFPALMIDETKIRQVIMNFTDNALHYTPKGGKIHVSLKETPEAIQFTVTDNGIGIPRHEQHHLFTKFFRAGNARKARPDGTGLGLFMAKKVVVAQGGSLIFKSQEGKGSTFGFTFAKSRLKIPETSVKQPITADRQVVGSPSVTSSKAPSKTR